MQPKTSYTQLPSSVLEEGAYELATESVHPSFTARHEPSEAVAAES